MKTQDVKRKLAAVFNVDVGGYGCLMSNDKLLMKNK